MKKMTIIFVVAVVMGVGLCSADAAMIFDLTGPDGLSASAVFTLNNPTELQITLINNSTGVPAGFDSSDQLLTGISWDFGMAVGATGTVVIGPGGQSINFSLIDPQLGAGADVSGEWGYGNTGGTGMLTNIVSTNAAKATQFSGANLDGAPGLDGPQAGICTDPPQVSLGGNLGAIADSVVITLTLDTSLANLNFLENGVVAEFGSDAAFVPEPTTICLLGFGSLSLVMRRRTLP